MHDNVARVIHLTCRENVGLSKMRDGMILF